MKNGTITNSLSHTTWNCKYHIVFVPKYQRKVFYGEKKREIGAILREFWCRGYFVDTVGKNTKKIAEYIANQLKEDKMVEQMSMSELLDPFK